MSVWSDAEHIGWFPKMHSTSCKIKLLLVALPKEQRRHYPHATLGYYLGGRINEWRLVGSPSRWEPTHWMPLPELPRIRKGKPVEVDRLKAELDKARDELKAERYCYLCGGNIIGI